MGKKRKRNLTHHGVVKIKKEDESPITADADNVQASSSRYVSNKINITSPQISKTELSKLEKKIMRTEEIVLVEDFLLKKHRLTKKIEVKIELDDCSQTSTDVTNENDKKRDQLVQTSKTEFKSKNSENNNYFGKLSIKTNKRKSCDKESSSEEKETGEDEQEKKSELEVVNYISKDLTEDLYGVIFLKQNQLVALKGYAKVSVLCGEIEINGYTVKGSTTFPLKEFEIYSPTTSSLQYIRDVSSRRILLDEQDGLTKVLKDLNIEELCNMIENMDQVISCVIIKKFKTLLPPLLKKLNHYNAFNDIPEIIPEPVQLATLQTDKWREIVDNMQTDATLRDKSE